MSLEEYIEYAPFEVEGFYEASQHDRRPGQRIYPGAPGEAL
jgi:hypothetical protein